MKYLKYPLFILLGLIILFIALSFVGPKDLNVTESIAIDAPAPVIYNLVNSMKESEKWNSWTKDDTTIVSTYNDIVSGVGSGSSWTSTMTGNGSQSIIESVSNQKVRSVLNFEGWDGDNFAEFNIRKSGDSHEVSYSFEGTELPFIMRAFALVTGMKKSMTSNYSSSLSNLKKISEERSSGSYDGCVIKEVDLPEKHFIMNRQEVDPSNIQQFYLTNLGPLFSKVQQANQEMNGMPSGLYFNRPQSATAKLDMAAAIPIKSAISIAGSSAYSIDSKPAIVLDFYGDYKTIPLGHEAINKYMYDRGYLQDAPVIEEYITDPNTEQDPNKWLTKITYYFSTKEG